MLLEPFGDQPPSSRLPPAARSGAAGRVAQRPSAPAVLLAGAQRAGLMARLRSGQGMVGELLVARSLMVPMALPRPGLVAGDCPDGVGAGLAGGAAAVDAGGADGGDAVVNDGAVGATDTLPGGVDDFGTTDCCPSLKREPSWLATSSTPTDRTATDKATQLVLILTA